MEGTYKATAINNANARRDVGKVIYQGIVDAPDAYAAVAQVAEIVGSRLDIDPVVAAHRHMPEPGQEWYQATRTLTDMGSGRTVDAANIHVELIED
jgi:hypothetical protein